MTAVHAEHHERTEENEEPWQGAKERCPLENVGETEEYEQSDQATVEPIIFHTLWGE